MKNWLTYEAGQSINFQRWEPTTLVTFDPAAVIYIRDPGHNFPNCENVCVINFIDGSSVCVMKKRIEVIADIQSAL